MPVAGGVPLSVPALGSILNQVGVLAATAHVYGGLPPYAVIVVVYACPADEAGSELVLKVSVPPGAEMVTKIVCCLVRAGELLSET